MASAATGGRNRSTVPASPASISAGPRSGPGVTSQSAPSSAISTPSARRPPAMRSVSRARSGRTRRLGPSASAASDQRPRGDRLGAGQRDDGVDGCRAVRRRPDRDHRPFCPLGGQPHRSRTVQPACGLSAFFAGSDAHQLAVGELEHAELGELAPVAGALHAAEGQLGRGAGRLVDEDHAGLDAGRPPTGPGRGRWRRRRRRGRTWCCWPARPPRPRSRPCRRRRPGRTAPRCTPACPG